MSLLFMSSRHFGFRLITQFNKRVIPVTRFQMTRVTLMKVAKTRLYKLEIHTMNTLSRTAAIVIAALSINSAAHAANIVEIASEDERFSTLVSAVSAAGLAETLQGSGPFTVFAPVNDAFAALPEGTVETLLKPENKEQLSNILLYHVDDRKLLAEQIPTGSNYFKPVLASERLCITKNSSGVSISDGTGDLANVIIANIQADNGVIHVIDKVLLPGTRPACH